MRGIFSRLAERLVTAAEKKRSADGRRPYPPEKMELYRQLTPWQRPEQTCHARAVRYCRWVLVCRTA